MIISKRKSNLSGWPGDMFEALGFKGASTIQIDGTGDFLNLLTTGSTQGNAGVNWNNAQLTNIGQIFFPQTLLLNAVGINAIDKIPVISDIMQWTQDQGIVKSYELQASPEIRKYMSVILTGATAVGSLINPLLGVGVGTLASSWDQFGKDYDSRIATANINDAIIQSNNDLAYINEAEKQMNADQIAKMKYLKDKIEASKVELVFKKYLPIVAGLGVVGSFIS